MVRDDPSRDTCLPDLLRAQVRVGPDRVAVRSGDETLTFRQLQVRSEQLARRLVRRGAEPDAVVGVFLEPSNDLMTAVWGVLFAGAAYLPLSPEYPDERVRYMVADSGARVVLTDEALRPRLAGLVPPGTAIVTVEETRADVEGTRADVEESGADDGGDDVPGPRPETLAYVIYTSGSTGLPKGILIEHRSIVAQLRWLAAEQGIDERRTVLQKTPLSFDAAQWEILAPACGSRVVMSEPGAYRDPERIVDLVTAGGVTTLQGVPTLLQALVDTGRLSGCTSLRQVFSGGEALSRHLAVQLLEALPGCELVNLYGPSECTINTSAHAVDPRLVRTGPDVVPIGRPVHGTRYYILGADGTPVAPGGTGELHVAGIQLARGYLDRPDLTAERFVPNPFDPDPAFARLYRTGDQARWNDDGTVQFVGRTDNQVKLRGFRIELDEIRASIETHDWVKRAVALVRDDPRTGPNLVAFVELDAAEAALMDQGNHGAHHQSKQSNKLQTRAQLSSPGCRTDDDLAGRARVDLPGGEASAHQRQAVFARKTYRFFEGGAVTRDDVLRLLAAGPASPASPASPVAAVAAPRRPESLTRAELGELLRWFGQFRSEDRLLPKYGYASPGALYATQLYLELSGVAGLAAGHYYYHPQRHQLVLMRPLPDGEPRLRVHLVGHRAAIEPVYRNNVREVLHLEAGHLVGLFDAVLPGYGLAIREAAPVPGVPGALSVPAEDDYLGTFEVGACASGTGGGPAHGDLGELADVYVQAHPGRIADLPAGQYRYTGGGLERVSGELVRKRDVVAINQQVYERASFGVTLLARGGEAWTRYVRLGRALHRLQAADAGIGLMSSGYSSETGNPLPAARRIAAVLGAPADGAASYFAVGGRVSDEQRAGTGMKEDAVHVRGPAEIIRDDLAERLPRYMVPGRVTVLDALPLTVNGKVDARALRDLDAAVAAEDVVPPRTPTEEAVAQLWRRALKRDEVSVHDDFFASGGNSIVAVGLIGRINRELGAALPMQAIFESPTVETLARRVDRDAGATSTRLVRLRGDGPRDRDRGRDVGRDGARDGGERAPVFCWPGLGGYPMNLRLLATRVRLDRPFLGVQAHGVNPGEDPYPTLAEMAARDVEMIRRVQPSGPYTLWGYSFGARVAFEAAHQLEQAGERVENLFLIAPGRPAVEAGYPAPDGRPPSFTDPAFVSVLFSVFAGGLDHPALDGCLAASRDEESFTAFVCGRFPFLDCDLVRRLVTVVRRTYRFEYAPHELARRRIKAPVTVFAARGDEPSFVEAAGVRTARPVTVVRLDTDHYRLLRAGGVDEIAAAVEAATTTPTVPTPRKDVPVPHVTIKHFPRPLRPEQTARLVSEITGALATAFSCDEKAVSIALEPVAEDSWNERVYVPEIVNGAGTLVKEPEY